MLNSKIQDLDYKISKIQKYVGKCDLLCDESIQSEF